MGMFGILSDDVTNSDKAQRPEFGRQGSGGDRVAESLTDQGWNNNKRQAYQQDYSGYNGSMAQAAAARGQQQDALSMQREAALGSAPSRAEMLGRQMADQGLQSQMAMAASARGGSLAQAAAMRHAETQQGAYMQQAQNQVMAARADEMAQARNAYMAGASGIRGQDMQGAGLGLQQTQMATQNEQFQRNLNQQSELAYEQMAQGALSHQMDADMQQAQIEEQERQARRQSQGRVLGALASTAGAVGGTIIGGPIGGALGGKLAGAAAGGGK